MSPSRIEDYAMLGDTETAALVGKDGSIDWLCTPRFDSAACFAALLGDEENGRWLLAPVRVDDPEAHAASGIARCQALHFGRVAIGDGTVDRGEDQHGGRRGGGERRHRLAGRIGHLRGDW